MPAARQNASSRESFTLADKRKVLAVWDSTGDIKATIKQCFPTLAEERYDARRKLIYSWRKAANTINTRAAKPRHARLKKQRPLGVATALSASDELKLVEWINRLRGEGVPVSTLMLSRKALKVAANSGNTKFVASQPWQRRFRKRHRFSMRAKTRQGQISPVEAQARAEAFGLKVQAKKKELGLVVVHNADQTGADHLFLICMRML
jgi:hypothetical protein